MYSRGSLSAIRVSNLLNGLGYHYSSSSDARASAMPRAQVPNFHLKFLSCGNFGSCSALCVKILEFHNKKGKITPSLLIC